MNVQSFSLIALLALAACQTSTGLVEGKVVDANGQPIADVVVTDGYNFTQTDSLGRYELDTDPEKSRFVYISTPSDYQVACTDGWNDQFYRRLDPEKRRSHYDFTLNKREKAISDFVYIAVSDPQVQDLKQFKRFQEETILDLKRTINTFGGQEIHLMGLGDLVWDEMSLFEPYKKEISGLGVIASSTIGNHDHDLAYTALSKLPNNRDGYAEERFEHYFGPYNYSFNVGNVHVVSLKDIDYEGEKKYQERFGQEQLDWLKKDLSYVKPGTILFINVHAPVFNQSDKGVSNADDAEAFREIVKDYNTHIFAGHTHYYENNVMSPTLYEHNIGAACGAWWAGDVNRCGAPNGYLVVEVKGSEISWHYKATNQPDDYQFRVYKPGEFKSYPDYLVVNVWDWDPSWKVCYSEKAGAAKEMERVDAEDQDYIDMHGKASGYLSEHLFRCQPSAGSDQVTVTVTNRWGEVFTKTISLR